MSDLPQRPDRGPRPRRLLWLPRISSASAQTGCLGVVIGERQLAHGKAADEQRRQPRATNDLRTKPRFSDVTVTSPRRPIAASASTIVKDAVLAMHALAAFRTN